MQRTYPTNKGRGMQSSFGILALVLAVTFTAGCTRGAGTVVTNAGAQTQPYAGFEARPIKALAPERVADLLAGRGAGYALAAELNHFPGPTHALEFGSELQLRPNQEQRVREVFAAMQGDAQRYGRELVDLEAELDRAFTGGTITMAELARLTGEIAAVEGRLRRTHLAAHLELKTILTAEQTARYDELRGYTTGGKDVPAGKEGPPMEQHEGSHQRH